MPFKFSNVCHLLSDLEAIASRVPPRSSKERDEELKQKTRYWFRCHRRSIDANEVDGITLLSTLLPEKRTDRVYGLQEARLCKVIARGLHLNNSNIRILQNWNQPGHGGLGSAVQRVLREFDCERRPGAAVTIEEIDHVLQNLASQCRFSGPAVRSFDAPPSSVEEQLAQVFRRLDSDEAKWFTRLILKNFAAAQIDYFLVISEYHFLLPGLLRFQDSFLAAIGLLKSQLNHFPSQPNADIQRMGRAEAARVLSPSVGTKVGRQTYLKARSMQHCVNMCSTQVWSAERKYDGEYCEVHVDLSRGDDCIQIFSKSGKDSTQDRKGIHKALRDCLRLGRRSCAFKKRCIVTGELVVRSDQEGRVLDFYHLRKHISRSGVFLGRDEDSQIKPGEHLMMMFYDILLLDNEVLLRQPYTKRRERLREVLQYKPGHAMPAERSIIDFRKAEHAKEELCKQFVAALANRCEGLVLKPVDAAYFRFSGDARQDERGFVIKLKKDYMQELGELRDVADFAVVGASFDSRIVHKSSIRNPKFTTFHLGCCVNKERSMRFGEMPRFQIVAAISLDQCIQTKELEALNNYAKFSSVEVKRKGDRLANPNSFDLEFTTRPESKMQFALTEPCVVEVLGSGFERPSNCQYYMLRHPRILKVHADRTWRDACTRDDLDELAKEARNASEEGETQEMSQLMRKIQFKFHRRRERDRTQLTSTPRTTTTISPRTASTISPKSATMTSPAVVRAVRHIAETPTPDHLPRRSPRRQQPSPILVRIDTSERLPNEAELAEAHTVAALPAQESLPTPPISSANPAPTSTAREKRKAAVPTRSSPRKRPRSMDNVSTAGHPTTALAPKSHNARPASSAPSVQADTTVDKGKDRNMFSPTRLPAQSTAAHVLSCPNADCPFARSIVFLSACVRGFPWVSESLLPWHNGEHAIDLHQWARDLSSTQRSTVIAESLAFPDRQKLVLVESKRIEATMLCIGQVKRLQIRDLVLFFDWRVLEDWQEVESKESQADALTKSRRSMLEGRFFGFTCWSSEQKKVVFMHQSLAKMPRGWLEES